MAARSGKGSKLAKSTPSENRAAWWTSPWKRGSDEDPDSSSISASEHGLSWHERSEPVLLDDQAILGPLEAQFGQVRSKERVRELAEVFTHQREVDAMLDMINDAFSELDIKFLEPACGSGNFLVEILKRKLLLVTKHDSASQEHYEFRLLRAAASVYGVDISPENVTEARARIAHLLLHHYQSDANTVEPTQGFLNAAALIIGDNIVLGDTMNGPESIELCDWRVFPGARFQRRWSFALVPEIERGLFWQERVQDIEPVHYSELSNPVPALKTSRKKVKGK